MIGYDLKLAIKSLRRDPGLTTVMILSLALGVAMFATGRAPLHGASSNPMAHRPGVHLVSVARPHPLEGITTGTAEHRGVWDGPFQTYLSHREVERLSPALAGLRSSPSASTEAAVQIGSALEARAVRLCGRDLFAIFGLELTEGRPWSAAADRGQAREAVISESLSRELFGTASGTGRAFRLAGADFMVVGILRDGQTKHYESRFITRFATESIFLPFAIGEALQLPPLAVFTLEWGARTFDELRASNDLWIYLWVETPEPGRLAASLAQLEPHARLLDYPEFARRITFVPPSLTVFSIIAQLALAASAFNLLRLLLAKLSARRAQLGMHRALGATRRRILVQQTVEATLVGLLGGALGLGLGGLSVAAVNVGLADLPTHGVFDVQVALVTMAIAVAIGAVAGAYASWSVTRRPPALFLRQTS